MIALIADFSSSAFWISLSTTVSKGSWEGTGSVWQEKNNEVYASNAYKNIFDFLMVNKLIIRLKIWDFTYSLKRHFGFRLKNDDRSSWHLKWR